MSTQTRDAEEALAALTAVRARLETAAGEREALMAERIACYRAARAAGLSFVKIADAAGVTGAAVFRALEREELQAAHDAGQHTEPVTRCPSCEATLRALQRDDANEGARA